MDQEKVIKAVGQFTEDLLAPLQDYFLVEVKVASSHQISVFIDADHGASIDTLARINRSLYAKIEETRLFGEEGNFSLEVSSPGLDEPLKLHRQYVKNIGRQVEVLLNNGIKELGTLKEVTDDSLSLETVKGTKKEKLSQVVDIPFNQIKFTKVRVVF